MMCMLKHMWLAGISITCTSTVRFNRNYALHVPEQESCSIPSSGNNFHECTSVSNPLIKHKI